MEMTITLAVLYLLAGWTWGCLACVAEYWLPRAILLQQRIGAYTPRPLYRVARRGRWVAAVGATVGAAGVLVGQGTETAIGLLAVGIVGLTYLLSGVGKLLHPRVVEAVLVLLERGRPGEPPSTV